MFFLISTQFLINFFSIFHFWCKSSSVFIVLYMSLLRCVKFFSLLLKYFLANFYMLAIGILVEFSSAIRASVECALLCLVILLYLRIWIHYLSFGLWWCWLKSWFFLYSPLRLTVCWLILILFLRLLVNRIPVSWIGRLFINPQHILII